MDLLEIEQQLLGVRVAVEGLDDEKAHSLEDALRRDFIRYIAEYGTGELKVMARAVLETEDMDFSRWCA